MAKKIIIFSLLLLVLGTQIVFSQPIKISFGDGRPEKLLNTELLYGYNYIKVNDLCTVLRASKYWYPSSRKLILKFDTHEIKLAMDNSVVIINKAQVVKLVFPVVMEKGQIYVPVEFLDNVLSEILPLEINGEKHENVTLHSENVNIKDISFSVQSTKTIARINTTEELNFDIDLSQKSRLIVTIYEGKLDAGTISTDVSRGLVSSISAYQTNKLAQISFALAPTVKRAFADPAEGGISVTVEGETANQYDTAAEKGMDDEFDVIVIDPGHGGRDPGAVGPTGLKEKDINLAIAKKLKDILEKNLGVRVILTRYDDTFIGLRRRTEIANNAKADIFVSIHCNASPSRNARGSETYFLSLARTTEARAVEARENKVIEFEIPEEGKPPSGILELILWDMAQNEFHKESSQLAEKVQDELNKNLGIRNRGINQAGFHVLKGAFMPAILIESAFISNRKEEQLLNSDAFQEEIAQGIFQGLKVFIEAYKNR